MKLATILPIFFLFSVVFATNISLYPGECYSGEKISVCIPKDTPGNITLYFNITETQIIEEREVYVPITVEKVNQTLIREIVKMFNQDLNNAYKELNKLRNYTAYLNQTVLEKEQTIANLESLLKELEKLYSNATNYAKELENYTKGLQSKLQEYEKIVKEQENLIKIFLIILALPAIAFVILKFFKKTF